METCGTAKSTRIESDSTVRRFLRNVSLLFGSSIVSSAATFLFTAYAARRLGVARFGTLSTVQIVVTSLVVLTDIGLTNVIVREVAQNREKAPKIAGSILTLYLCLGLLAFTLIAALSFALGYGVYTRSLIGIYGLSLIPIAIGNGCVAIFNGHERMGYSTISSLANALAYVGCIAAVALDRGIGVLLTILLVGFVASAVINLIVLRARFGVTRFVRFDPGLWRALLRAAWPFGLMSIVGTVGVNAGVIMLSRMVGETAVGYYNAANKINSIFMFLIGAYNAAVFPVFSRLQASSRDSLQQGYAISMKLMLTGGLSLAVGLTVLAGPIVHLIFPGYDPAIPALQALAWFTFFVLLSTVTLNIMFAEGRQREGLVIHTIGMVATLLVNLFAVPRFGAAGVGLGLIVYGVIQFVLSLGKISGTYRLAMWPVAWKAALPAAAVGALGIVIGRWNVVLTATCMTLAFTAFLWPLGIFDRRDWATLSHLPVVGRFALRMAEKNG